MNKKTEASEIIQQIRKGIISPAKGNKMLAEIKNATSNKSNNGNNNQDLTPLISGQNQGNLNIASQNANKAIVINKPGKISTAKIKKVTIPPPSSNEIQISVKAASLNFGDLLCIKGLYPTTPDYPFTPGFEVSGVISEIGNKIKGFKVGDKVIALTGSQMGGHATKVNVPTDVVVLKPENISFENACAFPIVFLTMKYAFELAQVKPNEKVLIQTACGGTGLISIQLAQQIGAEIFATAGSEEKCNYLKNLGIQHVINYRENDFAQEIKKITKNKGVDVIFNTLSGDSIQKGIDILAPFGRYIEIAMTGLLSSSKLNLKNLVSNQTFFSIDLRKLMMHKEKMRRELLNTMYQAISNNEIKPINTTVFSFEEINKAYDFLESRKNIGKVVISFPEIPVESPKYKAETVLSSIANETQTVSEDIAIIGMSGMFPGAKNLDEYWNNISQGIDCLTDVPKDRWDIDEYYDPEQKTPNSIYCRRGGFLKDIEQFDPFFFHISGSEAQVTDPQQRLFLMESYKALENAGYASEQLEKTSCGIYVGAGASDYMDIIKESNVHRGPQAFWGNEPSVLASRLSYFMNLKGPAVAINTACSSSMVALHLACKSLVNKDCEIALAGGVFIRNTADFYVLNSNAQMLSKEGKCKTFDNDADGYVPGEGVGVVVLKKLSDAIRDKDYIHGIIKSSGLNQDGRTNGITAPSTISQTDLERHVYKSANINPENISYIETHGTGTKLGDPIEFEALCNAFKPYTNKRNFCALGSVKTNIGHSVASAGIAGIIKTVKALQNKQIPPSLNFNTPNQHIDFENSPFFVNTSLVPWNINKGKSRIAAVSAFGFSGTNAHILLEEAPVLTQDKVGQDIPTLIVISAKTKKGLLAKVDDLHNWLAKNNQTSLQKIANTLLTGRQHFLFRWATVVGTIEELVVQLADIQANIPNDNTFINQKSWCYNAKQDLIQIDELTASASLITDDITNIAGVKQTSKLAELYVKGANPNWRTLYGQYGKTPLPTYPFELKKYTVKKETNGTGDEKPGINLITGTILDAYIAKMSTENEYVFLKNIQKEDPIVAHHIVKENYILPGVAHIELAYESLASLPNISIQDYRLTDFAWLQPIIASQPLNKVYIYIKKQSDKYEYKSLSLVNNKEVLHSKGIFEPYNTKQQNKIDLNKVKENFDTNTLVVQEPYKAYAKIDIVYGTFYQGLQKLLKINSEIFGYIEIPESHIKEQEKYNFPPTILDAALQSFIGFHDTEKEGDLVIPFSFSQINYYKPLKYKAYTIARQLDNNHNYEVEIYDEEGDLCVRINEISFRKLISASSNFYYQPNWSKINVLDSNLPDTDALKNAVILYYNEMPVITQIKGTPGLNCNCIQIASNDNQAEVLSTKYFEKLLGNYEKIDTVYFIPDSKIDEKEQFINQQTIINHQKTGIYSFFNFTKSLIKIYKQQKLRINIILGNSFRVLPEDKVNPLNSELHGFSKTLSNEYPKWNISCVDMDSENFSIKELTGAVGLNTQTNTPNYSLVANRKGSYYERKLVKINFADNKSKFKQKGIYLIIGGMGGIGFELASHLLKQKEATVILIGRRNLNEHKTSIVETLAQYPGKLEYRKADINDYSSINKVIQSIEKEFGKINGLIHSALVLDDKLVTNLDLDSMKKVMAPKIIGLSNVMETIADKELDFVMLFSSSQSYIGNIGQSNYAAACTFKDAYAEYLRLVVPYPVLNVNWGFWGEVGVAATDSFRKSLTQNGLQIISNKEGIKAIEDIVANEISPIIPFKASDEVLSYIGVEVNPKKQIKLEEDTSLPKQNIIESKTEQVKTTQMHVSQDELNELKQIKLSEQLQTIFADILQFDRDIIDLDTPFNEFGIDSLSAVDAITKIKEILKIELKNTELFNYPTINKLAEFILQEFESVVNDLITPNEIQDVTQENTIEIEEADKIEEITNTPIENAESDNTEEKSDISAIEVAVVGMSCKFPDADNKEEFWDNLVQGKNSVKEIKRWKEQDYYDEDRSVPNRSYSKYSALIEGIEYFDPLFFNISPKEAELMDPQQRLLLQEIWGALEDAGYSSSRLNEKKCSVYIGSSGGDYKDVLKSNNIPSQAYSFTGNSSSIMAARISYLLNLKGASVPVDTACSSSLVAIHLACESIRNKSSEMAIAAGVSIMNTPEFMVMASKSNMLSPDGKCKTFDKDANGFVPGEAVGAIILKDLKKAKEDGDPIYAVISGSGINQDGKTNGITAPSSPSQSALELEVYEKSLISPDKISYIEAHGTGTVLGDPIEIDALTTSFRKYTNKKQYCAIGSVKTNIGHALAAAGIVGTIKLLLCMKNKKLVPSLNFNTPNSYINFDESPFKVNTEYKDWKVEENTPRIAAISSFGFSGTNSHIVFQEFENLTRTRPNCYMPVFIIPLSAKSSGSLNQKIYDLNNWLHKLKDEKEFDLMNMAYTLQLGRTHFEFRKAFAVSTITDLKNQLKESINSMNDMEVESVYGNNELHKKSESILNNCIITKDLEEYAMYSKQMLAMYEEGANILWKKLYKDEKISFISMPSYPFEREYYYITQKNSVEESEQSGSKKLHPLVGENRSTLFEQKYSVTISKEDFFIKDHRINQVNLMPGVAYIEMARFAASVALEKSIFEIANIKFLRPLLIQEESKEVFINFQTKINGIQSIFFNVYTESLINGKIIHATGEITENEFKNSQSSNVNIDKIKKRLPETLSKTDFYKTLKNNSVEYGNTFQSIDEMYKNDEEVLVKLSNPLKGDSNWYFHPSIADGALQSSIGILWKNLTLFNDRYYPYQIDSIRFYQSLPDDCYAHSRIIESYNEKSESIGFQIQISDKQGNLVAEVNKLTVKKQQFTPQNTKQQLSEDEIKYKLNQFKNGELTFDEVESLL